MPTDIIARTPSHPTFPPFIAHRRPSVLASPRRIPFSPSQSSFPSPHTPPFSPVQLNLPVNRKRARFPTPESPETPPAKKVRSDISQRPGATMEDLMDGVSKEEGQPSAPLMRAGSIPLSGGGHMGRQGKMRLSLQTNLSLGSASDEPFTARPDMPPSPSSLASPRSVSSRQSSPPNLPSVMSIKRNPKRLSLAIPSQPGPSSIAIRRSLTPPSDTDNGPVTPGPSHPPTMTMTLGRQTKARRPNLLSLITQPPSAYDPPPTPGLSYAYHTSHIPRRRSNTADVLPTLSIDPRSSRSAYPRLNNTTFVPLTDTNLRVSSPTPTISSHAGSLSTTPTSSPSLSQLETPYQSRTNEPYADGPIEIVPGVYLGAEDTMYHWSSWARSNRVRILNVAQEIDDPFAAEGIVPISRKGKGKVQRAVYSADVGQGRPEVEYTHLAWSHGESGLAEVDEGMRMGDVIEGSFVEAAVEEREKWRFWEAIRYMEEGRQRGEAVLIHCQCGVSRSATLVIAYTMALAASGRLPMYLGHLKGMQDTYDFIKAKSCWIGPNVSLVFQLVEFARNLTTLLSAHIASNPFSAGAIQTSFPSAEEAAQTEADWARQRAQFDAESAAESSSASTVPTIVSPSILSPGGESLYAVGAAPALGVAAKIRTGMGDMSIDEEGMRREAVLLDEAMRVRRMGRV